MARGVTTCRRQIAIKLRWPFFRISRGQRGQSLTEFALLAPVLITLTLGVADGGRAFFYQEAAINATRQAIRLAAHDHTYGDFACANNGGLVTRNMPDSGADRLSSLVNISAAESSTDGTTATSSMNNNPATTITLTWHCQGATAITNAQAGAITDPTNPGSDSIRAQVDYSFKLITPFVSNLFGGQTIHIRTDVRGRAEY